MSPNVIFWMPNDWATPYVFGMQLARASDMESMHSRRASHSRGKHAFSTRSARASDVFRMLFAR